MTELHALRDAYRSDKAALLAAMQSTGASTRGIRVLLRKLSSLAGNLLQTLWQRAQLPNDMALVAVGGFGRDQLFPYSDVDVLLLLPDGTAPEAGSALRTKLEGFIGSCWDTGLEIGSSVRTVAECLAGLVYVNALKPGAPAIFGTWPFVSDLRTGAMSGGSPEQALLSAACGQMAHFYDLTGGTSSGITDSKIPDAQAGAEKAYNHALVGNAGANLIYESAGMQASLLGFCIEALLIDNDILGATQRTIRGIDVTDEALSVETIRATCIGGPGHYLGSDQTLRLMQREYIYPEVGDRRSPNEWTEQGALSVVQRAVKKTATILKSHHPHPVPRAVDDAIRARLPIRLPQEQMGW